MAIPHTVDVTAFIDRHRVSRFQTLIVVLCFLIVAIDGFDTAAIGFIAPVLHLQWQLEPAQLGTCRADGRRARIRAVWRPGGA